jgi:2-keto-myo-inositol isomerase
MIDRSKISLNRILFPALDLEELFKSVSQMGLNKVELRNDLPQAGIIDPYSPEQVKGLSAKYGIQILTINALQKFNLGAILPEAIAELKELIKLAVAIDCAAIVLVPNNDVDDQRKSEEIMRETVTALKSFGPLFEDSGILGYVEPLGFKQCSLRSKIKAIQAIQESGYSNYKIVHDTFHHHLGPDTGEMFQEKYDISYTGLVHVSGVESDIATHQFTDDHRILITENDILKNLAQLDWLLNLGYAADISFEPFGKEVQTMEIEALKTSINQSIDYIINRLN